MKRILPVEELARDERFERINIEDVVFDPRNAALREREARNGFIADRRYDAPDAARQLMHGIFVGEIQALEGAGPHVLGLRHRHGPRRGAVRAEARHGPPVLGRGPPRRDLLQAHRAHGLRDRRVRRADDALRGRPATPIRCCASPA